MDKQSLAIIETSRQFLDAFNCLYSSIEYPEELLNQFFELVDDWDWIIYIHIKTSEWVFSHWYVFDLKLSDTESIVKWLKKYTENVLRLQYQVNV